MINPVDRLSWQEMLGHPASAGHLVDTQVNTAYNKMAALSDHIDEFKDLYDFIFRIKGWLKYYLQANYGLEDFTDTGLNNDTNGHSGDIDLIDPATGEVKTKKVWRIYIKNYDEIIKASEAGLPIPDPIVRFANIYDPLNPVYLDLEYKNGKPTFSGTFNPDDTNSYIPLWYLTGYTHTGNTVTLTGDTSGTGTVDANGNVIVPTAVSHAANADHATNADHAARADRATNADHAASVDKAAKADSATNADSADKAANADHATNADSATRATNADSATNAGHATKADSATKAANADHADEADHATNAEHAKVADKLAGGATGSFIAGWYSTRTPTGIFGVGNFFETCEHGQVVSGANIYKDVTTKNNQTTADPRGAITLANPYSGEYVCIVKPTLKFDTGTSGGAEGMTSTPSWTCEPGIFAPVGTISLTRLNLDD